jgi:8-oxo-dGTP pyrophosphatase MutT (NUDIX family)
MRQIHREIVGTFIFSSDGRLLLGKSRTGGVYKGFWVVPGGGIEAGETKLEAARRETLEEVGIDIAGFDVSLLDQVLTGESEKVLRETGERVLVDMSFYNFTVRADKPASEISITCEDDIAEASWHPLGQLSQLNLSPPTKTTLASLGYL